jgi:anaerobic ribonucleoside-triphosphate reductase activating protein
MMAEIVFILEPDVGRVTVESSRATAQISKEINRDLGKANVVNCARPRPEIQKSSADITNGAPQNISPGECLYLYRIYHHSTVDGPGRRSVIQLAGCSIRCAGCYVPETHDRENGKRTPIVEIVEEIEKRSGEHDGVTILGGEPFDQPESLEVLVKNLRGKGHHLTIYTGHPLENLLARESECVDRILADTDLLIDGGFVRELSEGAGEYRGSSNQRLILRPVSGQKR